MFRRRPGSFSFPGTFLTFPAPALHRLSVAGTLPATHVPMVSVTCGDFRAAVSYW